MLVLQRIELAEGSILNLFNQVRCCFAYLRVKILIRSWASSRVDLPSKYARSCLYPRASDACFPKESFKPSTSFSSPWSNIVRTRELILLLIVFTGHDNPIILASSLGIGLPHCACREERGIPVASQTSTARTSRLLSFTCIRSAASGSSFLRRSSNSGFGTACNSSRFSWSRSGPSNKPNKSDSKPF